MSVYDKNKLRRLDLTVLLIFLGLMRTGKAAEVAKELGLTNSSISHALRRLREVFEDELFIRRPHGLEATAFALTVENDIKTAVDALQSALLGPTGFQPATTKETLKISARDREIASLIPDLFQRLTQEAPGLRLSVQSLSRSATLQALRDGSLDFAVGFFSSKSTDIDMRRLRLETYLMVARPQHPIWQAPLTLDRYCAASHILVSSDGSFDGIVDQQLQELGKSRTVSLAIPSFISALIILAQTDFLCTLPALVVEQHAATFGLRTAKPPLEIRPFEVSLLSHRRNEKSPLHQWCRDKMLT